MLYNYLFIKALLKNNVENSLHSVIAFMGIGSVGGAIEFDEAFFRESFKDNHKSISAISYLSFKYKIKGL